MTPAGREELVIDGPAASAALIHRILDGQRGPPRDMVVLNAAAALWTAGVNDSTSECARKAEAAIDSGAAKQLLGTWVELSRG